VKCTTAINSSSFTIIMTDEEMWERLDELEKIELERREMHKYIKIFFM
jgi:gamma-glutamylcyclotransferase (GGCT)/AIG2-like uncharacterized protein YtfP